MRESPPGGRNQSTMPYNETLVAPMRAELTRLGVKELRTVADVDAVLRRADAALYQAKRAGRDRWTNAA